MTARWLARQYNQETDNRGLTRCHTPPDVSGCILYSDHGSQYCSRDYAEMAGKHCFTLNMSRKGNCWNNAPMESFWNTLKQEWLNEKYFHTRAETKSAIFEYFGIFYNRQRIHSTNNYKTPEEYYVARKNLKKAAA